MAEHDLESSLEKSRKYVRSMSRLAIAQRDKDREFHGLEREFQYHQAQMAVDFDQSKDIKHPRDRGAARETILRRFLKESGYIPKRYGVSERSVRVVSTTGHISREIDIALFDAGESLTLMNREDVYEVHPIESVYGVIQVKSTLTKKELKSGLENLASFKKLETSGYAGSGVQITLGRPKSSRGFSILFAYTTDMRGSDIVAGLADFAKNNPPHLLPNAVFVLDRGAWRFGDERTGYLLNSDLSKLSHLHIHSLPDHMGECLYDFYAGLMALLRDTSTNLVPIEKYFRLPLTSDGQSYKFSLGQFAEVGSCSRHGAFGKKITSENLDLITNWSRSAEPIQWEEAMDIAYERRRDDAFYANKGGLVRIFNPDGRPLRDILLMDATLGGEPCKASAYDSIQTAGMEIWIPYVYSAERGVISGCPKCALADNRKRKTQTKRASENPRSLG